MGKAIRQAVGPLYLLMCLFFGGSVGLWQNLLLQLVGVAIIAWAAASRPAEPLTYPARQLFVIGLIGLAIVALQLVPLPRSIWPHLGGRQEILMGYEILRLTVGPAPLSLTPHESVATLMRAIPPIALFCTIVRLRAYRRSWLVLALLIGTLAGILLGVLQVASPDPQTSPWYLYGQVTFGAATGFFANANHMAVLLVMALPFLAALLASARGRKVQYRSGMAAAVAGAALVMVVGAVLTRSTAAYVLAVPVLVASVLIVVPVPRGPRRWVAGGVMVLLAAAAAALALSPVGNRTLNSAGSVSSRAEIFVTAARAVGDFLPFGSGLGSFPKVYKLYEDHERVTRVVMNHAHNDYLELALELGIPGIALVLMFLIWWTATVRRLWRFSDADSYARAASIVSAAVLIHSLVDFPLRTAAISAVFAMCLGLMVARHRARSDESELWPTRHLVLK